MLQRRHHQVQTEDGWVLSMRQVHDPKLIQRQHPPLLIVPGYGMNSSIFARHPSGPSMEECFAAAGFEVWSVDLRGQGETFHQHSARPYGLTEMATIDVRTALRTVRERSFSLAEGVHGIGCSLGASLLYLNLAHPDAEPVSSIVSIGGPMSWVSIHPLLRKLFVSPKLAGLVPIRGTRKTVRLLLPLLLRFPKLVSLYLHPDLIDTSNIDQLVQSVEDPCPRLNREMAEWMHSRDLRIQGRTLVQALADSEVPLLCIAANADGVVPPACVFSAYEASQSSTRRQILVGDETRHFAHADLFVSRYSQELVFEPIAHWLQELNAVKAPSESLAA